MNVSALTWDPESCEQEEQHDIFNGCHNMQCDMGMYDVMMSSARQFIQVLVILGLL